MAKGRDSQKAVKKKSEKSLKEKRKEKKAKKDKKQHLFQIDFAAGDPFKKRELKQFLFLTLRGHKRK